MEEATKVVGQTFGQWMVQHLGLSILIVLFVLSMFFKIVKKEIDPLGWVVGWLGKTLTKDVRKDVSELKKSSDSKFEEIKADRKAKIDEMMKDYNEKIKGLRDDLDDFEKKTNEGIADVKQRTVKNCDALKRRMDKMESSQQKSNDMQTVLQIRNHVLDFANSCMNHRKHTKKEFENIIEENNLYEDLVKKYKIKNAVYTEDYNFVLDIYHQCQKEGSFLNEKNNAAAN